MEKENEFRLQTQRNEAELKQQLAATTGQKFYFNFFYCSNSHFPFMTDELHRCQMELSQLDSNGKDLNSQWQREREKLVADFELKLQSLQQVVQ